VDRAIPFQRTTLLDSNPFPVTATTVLGESIGIVFGLTEVSVGTGLLTVSLTFPDVPPGAAFVTVITAVDGWARSVLGTVTFSDVADTKVVVRAVPFQFTTLAGSNPVPVSVMAVAVEPATIAVGLTDEIIGTGLKMLIIAFVVKPLAVIDTAKVPAMPRSALGTVALSVVADTYVVARFTSLKTSTSVG
jgi:hypothetical protein